MNLLTVFLIALALAVDAFAVAVAAGMRLCVVDRRQTFRLAFHFGLFQALLNIGGWAAGLTVRGVIERFDHWIAFGLLALVGLHMIREGLSDHGDAPAIDPTRGMTLVVLSLATSIDSLAVGLSFAILKISIWLPALVIGLVASLLTLAGLRLGCLAGSRAARFGTRVEIIGGLVLIGIGAKILHDHGVF